MKKMLCMVLGLLLLWPGLFSKAETVYAVSDVPVSIDGVPISFESAKPIVVNGGIMVPVKVLCDELGYDYVESENRVEITPGSDCKNSEGACDKVEFEIGAETMVHFSGEYRNEIESVYATLEQYDPLSLRVDGQVYLSAFYLGRALDLQLHTQPDQLAFYTRNYLKALSAMPHSPLIFVTESLNISVENQRFSFDTKPFLDENGRLQVPVREFAQQLGISLHWFEDTSTVALSWVPSDPPEGSRGSGDTCFFTMCEQQYRKNAQYFPMDTTARIVNGRAFVPLRYLADALSFDIVWKPHSS